MTPPRPTLGEQVGYQPNVREWGAIPDMVEATDASISSTSTTLTLASALFASTRVGQFIAVAGAGVAGADLLTTIASFTSATEVELTDAASTTVANVGAVWGTDNTTELQAAINECAAHGVVLRLHFGKYMTQKLTLPSGTHIVGSGDQNSFLCAKPGCIAEGDCLVQNEGHPVINDSPLDAGTENTDIILQDFCIHGMRDWQTTTESDVMQLTYISRMKLRGLWVESAKTSCIFGGKWQHVQITGCTFKTGRAGNVSGNARGGLCHIASLSFWTSGETKDVVWDHCTFDGWVGHGTCLKMSAESAYPMSRVRVVNCEIRPGDSTMASLTEDVLGVEFWGMDAGSVNYHDIVIANNNVVGEDNGVTPNPIYGISVAGNGGRNVSIVGNTVFDCHNWAIELGETFNALIQGNVIRSSGLLMVNPGTKTTRGIQVVGNILSDFKSWQNYAYAYPESGITVYHGSATGKVDGVVIANNSVDLTGAGATIKGIILNANHASANIADAVITGNLILGDGTSGHRAISLEGSGTIIRTLIANNNIENVETAIGDYTSAYGRFLHNRFGPNVTTRYTGSIDATTRIIDISDDNVEVDSLGVRAQTGIPVIDSSGNVCLPTSLPWNPALQISNHPTDGSINTPNIVSLNSLGHDESQGVMLGVNSKYTGHPNHVQASKEYSFTALASTDVLTLSGLGNGDDPADDDTVYVKNLTGCAGLAADTVYYVVNKSGSTIQLSLSQGGAAVNITTDGSGKLVECPYASWMRISPAQWAIGFGYADNANGVSPWGTDDPDAGSLGYAFAVHNNRNASGSSTSLPSGVYTGYPFFPQYQYGSGFYAGSADPEGSVTASPGSIYMRSNGYVYVKSSGSGNTGWERVSPGAVDLGDAADIDGTGLTSGRLMQWDGTKLANGECDLGDANDVAASGFSTDQYAKWDGSKFVGVTTPASGPTDLGDAADVDGTGLTSGRLMQWDGTKLANGATDLGDSDDVNGTGLTTNVAVKWDGNKLAPMTIGDFDSLDIGGSNMTVDSSGNVDANSLDIGGSTRFNSSGEFLIKYTSASSEPTLTDGELRIWHDSVSGIIKLLWRLPSTGTQYAVTLS